MGERGNTDTKRLWDSLAQDWYIQVGDKGDANRRLNSDPVLWNMAGEVDNQIVLDAGCGTGYLCGMLRESGAEVIGVDFSDEMISIAESKLPGIDFRVDDCMTLNTIPDESIDLLVSNYVLMDLPGLDKAVNAFYRVLKAGGTAVIVISHPCFPQAQCDVEQSEEQIKLTYEWNFSYFEKRECVEPPWKHFKEQFVRYHRPLSEYWKAFTAAGFTVQDFDEPRIQPERYTSADSSQQILHSSNRPYSVIFKLEK